MRLTLASLVIVTVLIGGCLCPPPQLIHKSTEPKKHIPGASVNEIEEDVNKVAEDKKVDTEIDDLGLEYGRYLNEVVKVLDEDPEFAKKMENITHDQIISGEVARQIEMVAPEVRNRLDELKRVEMDRLRKLAMKEHKLEMQMEAEHGSDGAYDQDGRKWRTVGKTKELSGHVQIDASHIDHQNPHTFEAEDLQKLILQATNDLEELDRKRRRDFKQYEMEKEVHYRETLQNMTADQKHEAERKHEEEKRKHQQHPHINAPGSKHQFEEVWEEQDHMRKEDFNPQVFFQMHDITGDGFWDQEEVEAMLGNEVKKLYNDKDPHVDKHEMQEEFHRMREHIYKEIDTNHDGLISKKEFLDYSHSAEFQKDEGWKSVEEAPVYTEEELKHYEAQRQQLQDHYAKYGAYYDPVQMAYQQAVMQGGQTHNGQPVQYVMGTPQHVQNVQYHHVELPPQHNIHYVPQGQAPQQGQQYQALPGPAQGQQQPQIAGAAHPAQGGQPQYVSVQMPPQQQQYQQQQYHAPPPQQGQYHAVPPAQVHYQPPPPQQYQQQPQQQQQQQQQFAQGSNQQHYQPPVQNYQQPNQQQQQQYQQPQAGQQQQQQYHPPSPPAQQQQQQRPK